MRKTFQIQVSVPTDAGFLGHACNAPDCGQYFKVHEDDRVDLMQCPYCGTEFPQTELHTKEQIRHLRKAAEAEALYFAEQELQKILKKTFGSASARRSGFSYKPGRITKKPVHATYKERKVDTELQCPDCNCRFQVYGIFGFCPACGESNLQVYDTNWAAIEREVANAENPDRALRHAYGDLVSAFEMFCSGKAKRLAGDPPSFQILFDARRFFKDELGVDVLDGIDPPELLALRRIFQKRHVNIHSGGEITERYVKMIPEDKHLLGNKVEMSMSELEVAAEAMRKALLALVRAMERRG
jgi:Zn finger protein HypA/HybF involved in hydrogenase expression